jgi:cyclohexyl-isocyanide hydratase
MMNEFTIVFALYPRVTQLDFTAPLEVFARLPGSRCLLASVDGGTVHADGGISFSGVTKLSDISECALLCVPGGFGTVTAMEDGDFLFEIARLGNQAQYITSVCTGSLLLAAAGLLQGRRAACHWAWRDLLPRFGVATDAARVVRDGNIITGGGVTAGIDMALTVMAEIAGIDHAQAVQLALEYAPEPPFDCGQPERARPEILAAVNKRMSAMAADREAAVDRAARLMTRRCALPRDAAD